MARAIDREEQVDWHVIGRLAESAIQAFIAQHSRRPDFVFQRFLYVILLHVGRVSIPKKKPEDMTYGIRFDYEESSLQPVRQSSYRRVRVTLTWTGRQSNVAGFNPLLLASSITSMSFADGGAGVVG